MTANVFSSTAEAQALGFGLDDVEELVTLVIELIETKGPAAKKVVLGILRLIQLASQKNITGLILQLQQTVGDLREFLATFKAAFGRA